MAHREVKKFRDMERDRCRRMFGQAGTKSTNGSRQSREKDDDEDDDYLPPAEMAKIRSIYTDRFR